MLGRLPNLETKHNNLASKVLDMLDKRNEDN
jgi:hypothetical protein